MAADFLVLLLRVKITSDYLQTLDSGENVKSKNCREHSNQAAETMTRMGGPPNVYAGCAGNVGAECKALS